MNYAKTILRRFKTLSISWWYNMSTDMRKRQIGVFLCHLALYFYLLLIAVGLIGCCNTKNMPIQYVPIENDYRVIVRDSIVRIHDTVEINVPVEIINQTVPHDTMSILSTSLATSTAKIDNGKLQHSLIQSGTVEIRIDTCYITKIEEKVKVQEIPVEVIKEVKYIPKWINYSVLLNLIVIGFFGLRIYLKLK